MKFIKGGSALDGQRTSEKQEEKIKVGAIGRPYQRKTKHREESHTEQDGSGQGHDKDLYKNATKKEKYTAKPLPKMSDTMGKLKTKETESKANTNENNDEHKETEEGKQKEKQIMKTNKYRTFATKSSIVNESEDRRPTESWVIKVTNRSKKKTEKAETKSRKEKNIGKTSVKTPTESLRSISTPTKQTLKPTTIQETPQIMTNKPNATNGTPSIKPTTEAASTPSLQNDAENSGSGSQSVDSELKSGEHNGTKIELDKEGKLVNKDKQNYLKMTMSNTTDKYAMTQSKDEANEENASGDEESTERDGITEDINQTAKDVEKRILCVGDSITEGYYNGGTAFHPYTKRLSELLNAEQNHITYIVYNEGKSGECIDPDMIRRMPLLMEKYKPLNLVIILGGTNDLTTKHCNEQNLFDNTKTLHEMVHKLGIRTVAVTIPDSNAPMLPGRNEKESVWETVNDKIRDYAKGKDNVILCDLAEELPYRTMNDDEKKLFWDDDLHFTPMGYDKMAEVIYDVIQGNF